MISQCLLVLAATSLTNPFSDLREIPALSGFEPLGRRTPPPLVSEKTADTLAAVWLRDKDKRDIYFTAYTFKRKEDIAATIRTGNQSRQAATIAIDLPELAKKGFKTSYMGNPLVLETDIVVGKVWARVQLHRLAVGNLTSWRTSKDAGELVRADHVTIPFLLNLLPEIRKRAEAANRNP